MTKKQIILAAYVGGVNEHTLWEHPEAGSQIEFSTFKHVAQKAEAGKFDYFFLAEGRCEGSISGRFRGANYPRREGAEGPFRPDFRA